MSDVLRQKWRELVRDRTVDLLLADQAFDAIREHYAEPSRFYHTFAHIQIVLEIVEGLAWCAQNLKAVKLAAWLHDVIYDSRASDNEERSAHYAEDLCARLSIPEGRLVAALIRTTKTHDANGDADAQVLIDADLAILGAGELAYQTYSDQIRQEYAWVPEQQYRQGRRRVLESFLSRSKIYYLLAEREAAARRNINAEIARFALI